MPALSPAHLALGAAVRSGRRRLGLSQEALADRAGLHRNHIGLIERGEVDIGLRRLLLVSGALEIRAADLIASAEVAIRSAP